MKSIPLVSALALSLLLGACSSQPDSTRLTVQNQDIQHDWRLMLLDGKEIADTPRNAQFTITDTLAIQGRSGCNQFSGQLSLEDNQLQIHQALATKMLCPPNQMQQEQALFNLLNKGADVTTTNKLMILTNSSHSAAFIKTSPQ